MPTIDMVLATWVRQPTIAYNQLFVEPGMCTHPSRFYWLRSRPYARAVVLVNPALNPAWPVRNFKAGMPGAKRFAAYPVGY